MFSALGCLVHCAISCFCWVFFAAMWKGDDIVLLDQYFSRNIVRDVWRLTLRALSINLNPPLISLYFAYKQPDVLVFFKVVLNNSFPGFAPEHIFCCSIKRVLLGQLLPSPFVILCFLTTSGVWWLRGAGNLSAAGAVRHGPSVRAWQAHSHDLPQPDPLTLHQPGAERAADRAQQQ